MEHDLLLYYFDTCPYCQRVLRYLQERDIRIPMRNTSGDFDAFAELRRIGGKTQVPCLVIDGTALYESEDIIHWFEEHWDDANSTS